MEEYQIKEQMGQNKMNVKLYETIKNELIRFFIII